MKNFRRSKKALSPVVASIILIAVTVAVSIAVAAWMGALTIGFMGTEEVRITNVEFLSASQAQVTAKNTGSIDVTLTEAYVGNNAANATGLTVITPGQEIDVIVDGTYVSGTSYQFKLVSSKGNPFVYTATAPTS
jgi:flagellin-like protein